MARIKIDINTKGDGKGDKVEKCTAGKWAKISYKGYLKNGQQIMDTDASGGDVIFSVGASQTFKCFDLALTQVKPGAKIHIECPNDLVYGGASIQAPLGGEWIPKNSDMDFDIEVKYCNRNPGQYSSLYWGDDLEFWAGPPELKPGNCVEMYGKPIVYYWENPQRSVPSVWCQWTEWGMYSGTWDGPRNAKKESEGAYRYEVVKGLDGGKDTISFVPAMVPSSYVYLH